MTGHNRRTLLKTLGAVSTVGLTGLTGCIGGGGGGGADDITIGVPTSLSGAFAPYGEGELAGARVAASNLEEELGMSIRVVEADTETNPGRAVEQIEQLVTEDDADVALGGVSSASGARMGAWATDNEVPFVAHGASDSLTGPACGKYMFSVYSSNTMMANAAAPRMAEMVDSWYILYSDYTWGKTANDAFTRILEANGASIVDRDAVPFPGDDYTQYLNNVQNSDAEGLALLVAGLDQRLSMSQLLNEGMEDQYTIAMHQLEDISLWGVGKEAAAAIDIASMGWVNTLDSGSEFKSRIAEEVGASPFVRHYMGYMSADQLVRAADRAGSTNGADIVSELEGHTVTGPAAEIQAGSGDLYWRECDHQLIQPAHAARGRSVDEMVDDPYRQWFEAIGSVAGDDAAPSCTDAGCSFEE